MKNPYFQGVEQALAMKQFAKPTDEQQYDSINRALSRFGGALGAHPTGVRRGFLENLSAFAPAISQGNTEYLNSQQAHEASNAISIKEALAREMEQRKMEMQERKEKENNFWKQRQYELGERRLDQQQQFQNQNQLWQKQKYDDKHPPVSANGLIPITSIKERNLYSEDYKGLGTALKDLEEVEKSYKKLRADTANNTFDPMLPLGRKIARAEELFAGATNKKELLTERAARDEVKSKVNKFTSTSERVLKGGVLGPQIIKLFKEQGIYPSYEDDTPQSFEVKLASIKEELQGNYKAAELALKHNVHVNPLDIHKFDSPIIDNIQLPQDIEGTSDVMPQAAMPQQQGMVLMRAQNGSIRKIKIEDVPRFEAKGCEVIDE